MDKRELTKTERKAKYNNLKRTMKEVWTIEMESEEDKGKTHSLSSHFKRYTVQDRKIVVQQPVWNSQNPRESYDRLKNAKKINLTEDGEEPILTYIAADLEPKEEELLIETLKEYKDVFAWSYKDLKWVDLAICQHTIPMNKDAKPTR